MWAPIFHEDQVERIPGPDVGDYAGLPINDAMRMRADSWDASLLTLPEHQCKPHPSTYGFRGVGNLRVSAEVERQDAVDHQAPHPHSVAGAAARHLDGWSSTSARIRRAYLAGILDGPVGRQRARREDDAPQGGVDSSQRAAHHRPGDDDRALHPARELPHARVHDRGSQLPHRAADQDERISADAESGDAAVSRATRPSRCRARRATCRTICPARTRSSRSSRRSTICPQNGVRGGAETALPEFMSGPGRQAGDPRQSRSTPIADPRTRIPDPPTTKCTRSTCRATCGCFTAAGSTPRSRSVTKACSSWTR